MPQLLPYAGYIAYAALVGGAYLYASSMDTPSYDNMLKADDSTVNPADTGVGFAPMPQYPASELPVPVIYGKARINGLIVHSRPYGDNFSKCHYVLMWGDKGYSMDQMYVDKYQLEDLPNYYGNIQGAVQDSTNSWANTYPLGGDIQISLNNSGSFGVMRTQNTTGTLVASTPAIFYGGGTITARSLHTWPKSGSTQTWQWTLTNLDDPLDIEYSPVYNEHFEQIQHVDGGSKGDDSDIPQPGSVLRDHEFTVSDTLSRWSLSLVCTQITNGTNGAQICLYNFTINDVSYNELVTYNGTVSHVHLVKDESLTSNQPVVNAVLQKTANGNPATSLYEYLTDTAVGLGLRNVDSVSATSTALWCDTEEYYYNRGIAAFYPDDKLLKEMCTCGRIVLYEEQGQIKMMPDKAELVSYLVDDTEIMPGSLRIGINTKTAPNRIEGQYTEPFYGHTVERVYAEDHDDIAATGARAVTLGLAGVTSQLQAHNLSYLALQHTTESKYWCSFDTGQETVGMFRVGSVIEITSETNALIDGKKWRVQKIDERELFKYNVYCKQYTDEIYDLPPFSPWYEQITELGNIHGWPGPDTGAATIANLYINDVTFPANCVLETRINLTWVEPTERYDRAQIYYSHNNIDWIYVGATSAEAYTFTWPMRYGVVYIKVVSVWGNVNNDSTAPVLSQYITGDQLCIDEGYPGYGRGQYGMQPFGG